VTASTRAWCLRLRVRQGPACMGWQPFWLNKVIRLTRRHTTMELWRPVFGALHACEQGGQDQATLHEHLHVVGWWLCYGARRAGLLGLGETEAHTTAAIATHPLLPLLLLLLLPSLRQLAWHSIIQIELLLIPAKSLPRHLSFRRG